MPHAKFGRDPLKNVVVHKEQCTDTQIPFCNRRYCKQSVACCANAWHNAVCVRYAAAELDCSEAIARDPAYVKAICRRATARVALKNYEGARSDYSLVLDLEPSNRLARTEMNAIDQVSQAECNFSEDKYTTEIS